MDIIIDYDNGCVILNNGDIEDLCRFHFDSKNLKNVRGLLAEILNSLADKDLSISFCEQDDGSLTTIEEY
jgi:hypothetical protein